MSKAKKKKATPQQTSKMTAYAKAMRDGSQSNFGKKKTGSSTTGGVATGGGT
jgi:hypothetical protein